MKEIIIDGLIMKKGKMMLFYTLFIQQMLNTPFRKRTILKQFIKNSQNLLLINSIKYKLVIIRFYNILIFNQLRIKYHCQCNSE